MRILPQLDSHIELKLTWILCTKSVFVQIHRAFGTRILHGVSSEVRNRDSVTDLAKFWMKYRSLVSGGKSRPIQRSSNRNTQIQGRNLRSE